VTFFGTTAHLDTRVKQADKDRSRDISVEELAGFIDFILKYNRISRIPCPKEGPLFGNFFSHYLISRIQSQLTELHFLHPTLKNFCKET
jgi:hypothetical protein